MSFDLIESSLDKVVSYQPDYCAKKTTKQNTSTPSSIRFIDLFAGIGGVRIPFDELGYRHVFSSEIDSAACKTYETNFGESPAGDITEINERDIPEHDLLLAGFPCQAFSIMGKKLGFADTRGTMFFEVERILKYHRPKVILLENVKQLVTHDNGQTLAIILDSLQKIGYFVKWKVLNALNFGLPQKRERVVIVGFLNEEAAKGFSLDFLPLDYNLHEILERDDEVDGSLFASNHIIERRKTSTLNKKITYPSIWHENKAGNISVLEYACALRTGASYNYLLVNGYRRLSSRELLRLQGFPDTYKIAVSHAEIRRQTGNSVPVNMMRAVAGRIDNALQAVDQKRFLNEQVA
jgi:DNA (cytosine-5)-methyltransferase 1